MRAVLITRFGGPDVLALGEIASPQAAPGHVLVRVGFAPVNPSDLMLRSGAQAAAFAGIPAPWIPGMEFAGTIAEVGDGVSEYAVGDSVFGAVNPRTPDGGAQAELISVAVAEVQRAPESMSLPEASVIPMNGVTATIALDAVDLPAGSTLLVTGAAGMLGGYVVELAARAGLSVIAHGRPGDVGALRGLGAAYVISGSVADAVRAIAPYGVDALVDAANLGGPAQDAVRDDGIVVHVRKPEVQSTRLRHCTVSVLDAIPGGERFAEVAALAEIGVFTPRVATVLPFTAVSHAHQLVENGGQRGRVVLDLAPDRRPRGA